MQDSLDKKFDEFIREEMNEFELDTAFDPQWNRMASTLNRKSFFRFAYNRFNLYYLLILAATITVALLFFYQKKEASPATLQNNSRQMISTDTSVSITNQSSNKLDKPQKQKGSIFITKDLLEKDSVLSNVKPETDLTKVQKDTIVAITPVQPAVAVKPIVDSVVKKAPKKIKYVTKRDTIIALDTNRVRKKR